MTHDDAGEDALDRIDLHAWRVPPPAPTDRASIVARALQPAARPRRSRTAWLLAAFAIGNVVLAAILVIVISRPAPHAPVIVRAAGGGVDAQTDALVRRLAQEQRDLEDKLAEVQELRSTVEQLLAKVHECEQTVKKDRPAPAPKPPGDAPSPAEDGNCDEVSCVLTSYESACCTKFRTPSWAPKASRSKPAMPALPDALDRSNISTGIAAVRSNVTLCGQQIQVKGKVKIRVRVAPAGKVTNVAVESTPDADLGACVAAAIQKATFAPTLRGGSFGYPFVF